MGLDSADARAHTVRFAWLRSVWPWLALATLVGAVLRLVALSSVPPGLHFDEAVYGLQALEIYNGARPIFFPAYTGREPLYMYLMAVVFRLVGVGKLGLRLTSAMVGVATIPLVFVAMRAFFSPRVGLLAAAYTAVSYWHLTVSRNGYPNILIPPIECLAMYGLWRGYRDGRRGWMLLGGAFTGLVLYTYLAARFFPITVGLCFLYALAVDWRRARGRLGWLTLAALMAVAVFAPLGLYFLRHPSYFVERANQVLVFRHTAQAQVAREMVTNLGRNLAGLFWRGDPRSHYNLPGRPVLSPPASLLFLAGLGLVLRRWRQPPYGFLPLWILGMCLPAVLTADLMPQGQRLFGVVPAVYGLVALGLDAVLTLAAARRSAWSRWALAVLLAALLAYEGVSTAHTYLNVWAQRPETFYAFHGDYELLAQRAECALDAGQTVVIQAEHYRHPAVVFGHLRTLDALWVSGDRTMIVPHRPGSDVLYLWPAGSHTIDEDLAELLARATEPLEELYGPHGELAVRVLRLRSEAVAQAQALPTLASFGEEVDILGWELSERQRRDRPLEAMVHWRVRHPGDGQVLALHLVDENGVVWGQDRSMGYFRENWQSGDTVYQLFRVSLPAGIPAGRYEARLLFSPEEGGLLPVVREGRLAGTHLSLGFVQLRPAGAAIQPLASQGQAFGPDLRAIAHDRIEGTRQLGDPLQFSVTWQAFAAPGADHLATVSLVGADGRVLASHTLPLAYQHPTTAWQPGEVVRAIYTVPLTDLNPGAYTVRLRVQGLSEQLDLGTAHLEATTRLYEAPPMAHPLMATMGSQVDLLGYDLEPSPPRAGQALTVTLYWRARAMPAGDYKVFVHLVDADGRMLAQHDAAPANWTRPTTGWAVGEVVIDEHTLTLPPEAPAGDYRLYVGLYDAVTLQRLPVQAGSGHVVSGDRLLLEAGPIGP